VLGSKKRKKKGERWYSARLVKKKKKLRPASRKREITKINNKKTKEKNG
jgi:hypothetical protein